MKNGRSWIGRKRDKYDYVSDSVLQNVSWEATTKALWDKLGTLYQYKSLVNKLFLWKKLYTLRMKDGDSVTEHLNAFNTVVSVTKPTHRKIEKIDQRLRIQPLRGGNLLYITKMNNSLMIQMTLPPFYI